MLRFGIIGCGTIGKIHAEVISKLAGANLAAVSDVNKQLGVKLAEDYRCNAYQDYLDMIHKEDIDVVNICVPSGLHCQVALDAAKAGKHIIVEKPVDISVERADRMIHVCRENGVKLSVISQHRFDEPVQVLKKAVDEGILGKLYFGTSKTIWYRDPEYYNNTWKGTLALDGGGALINQSIHYIDLLLYIMGPATRVSGKCSTLRHKNMEVEDIGAAVVEFENHAIGTIEGTTLAYPGLYTELSIYAENGTVNIRNDQLELYKLKSGVLNDFERLLNTGNKTGTGAAYAEGIDIGSHIKQFNDMVRAINDNRDPLVTGEDGKRVLQLIKAIYESSQRQERIVLGK